MFDGTRPEITHTALDTTFVGVAHSLSTSDLPINQFRGIKYASVPARFRQAKLFTSYPRVTDATRYGPICPQVRTGSFEEELVGVPPSRSRNQALKQNEFECLNLNITCPGGLSPDSLVPVMLWIHGGGNRGSGSSWVYDGGALVRKGMEMRKPVIMVTCNFRLGLFGFAASPILRDDNKIAGDNGVGNYGLRDQRCAMEWIHSFILGFGGDPSNVTLFGQSTGAAHVLSHLQSAANQSRPLFHRAIVQSAIVEHNVPDVHSAGWYLSRVMSTLRVSTLEQLRAVNADRLVAVGHPLRATDDGIFFRSGWREWLMPRVSQPRHRSIERETNAYHTHIAMVRRSSRNSSISPSRATARAAPRFAPSASYQPLLIGDCANESFLWSVPASRWTSNGVVRRVKAVCQSLSMASALLRGYDISPHTTREDLVDRVLELIGDARVSWPTDCMAEHAKWERGGRNVWRYVFDQEGPSRGVLHHAVDLIYLFDNVPFSICAPTPPLDYDPYDDDPLEALQDVEELKLKLEEAAPPEAFYFQDHSTHEDRFDDWAIPSVDQWSYNRVRNAIQERWITFAHGESPWNEEKVYVFGPEGETGERSKLIFEGRRKKKTWKEAFEPLGLPLVQKVGIELSNGPPITTANPYPH